ncbi:leucine rich repeat domain containing protein [Acanthamoeba castellanii str. Neff]|uniref:Leucine rich repeat domain containing protein n=1 Tax=Acanthamoeba castellanii (strain ATCC 30010 / Neff) TaxID=1257118 RepID=L8GPV5_ACACF|nr:leucine rich repeat domain containing protein [Acanthamoeba castellanii str. Neff]ELR15204.1 leucine rich repeat domain containing protein [Acanthamoeba castellanii str. Neff]
MEQSLDEDEMEMGRGTSGGAAAEAMMMDTTPVERRHAGGHASSVVRSLRRLCVEAVADHFGRHSRELLNLSPAARELLLAHLKARFNPARRHRFVLPDVRSLDLSRCATLSSRTLAAVSSHCFQLTALDLSHAASLTDADLRPLFPASFPFITTTAATSASSLFSFAASASPSFSSAASSPASSGALAFPLTASPSSSLSTTATMSTSNSYSFASSPAPQTPIAQQSSSSPGFWNRLFSRSPQPAASSSLGSASASASPTLSPATSNSSLSSLPAVALFQGGGDDISGLSTMSLRAINLRNCSGLTSASVENILRLWGSSLQSLTLDGDRINPASVAALASASHLTRLALLHSPYLKPIPVSEMKSMDKAEESKYPVFEWQLMPALQGCLTPAMTELVLHFDSETITEEIVCQIVGLCGAKLRLLEMPLPSPEAWKLVLRHCTSLRKLDLYGWYCTDDAVSGMAHFPSATEVTVRSCSLSDESFIRIAAACPKTTKVELRSVETVTDVGMEAIAKAVAGNLRELTIASLEQVTDTALHHFAEYCPNLRTLQLSGMSADDQTQTLTGATVRFGKLKELRLSSLYCPDHTVAAVLAQCTQLRALVQPNPRAHAPPALDDVGGMTGAGIKSSSLWHLQLRSTPQLTDEGVESMVKQCPELRSVRIKHQATLLRSQLCLLDAPRLLELRVGEGNLLDDALFRPDSLHLHQQPPHDDHRPSHVESGDVLMATAKAEAIDDMNKEADDERGAEADQKTSEDRYRPSGAEADDDNERASKESEDDPRHRPPPPSPPLTMPTAVDEVVGAPADHSADAEREESGPAAGLDKPAEEAEAETGEVGAATARSEEPVVAEVVAEEAEQDKEASVSAVDVSTTNAAAADEAASRREEQENGGEADEAAAAVEAVAVAAKDESARQESEEEVVEEEPMAMCPLLDVKLKNCPLVTDRGIGTLMRRCRRMARLRLYYFPQVTGRTLGGAHLRSLVLDQCGLTNDGFISLIRASPGLREIEISGAGGAGTGHPRELEFTKLSDEGLRELDRHCPRLRSLSLSFLNSVALKDIALPHLESLALEDMPAVTDESLGGFVGRSTRLCRLDVRAGVLRVEKGTPTTSSSLATSRGSRGSKTMVATSVMNVTAPFVEALKAARPNLAVTYRLID